MMTTVKRPTDRQRMMQTPGTETVLCPREGHGMSFGSPDRMCDRCYTEGGGNPATRILKAYIRDATAHESYQPTESGRRAARERRELLERVLDATVAEMARLTESL
jgi:hypothetical protein